MKLKVRYDEFIQAIELDEAETEELWVSLSLEGDGITQDEKEDLIQAEFEKQFNRPDYNSWHKFNRHRGYSIVETGQDDDGDDVDTSEPLMKEVADARIFLKDEIERDRRAGYEDACQLVRRILAKKPKWADAFIAVRLDGVSVNDYASAIGVSDASIVSKWLERARKKLEKDYPKRQI